MEDNKSISYVVYEGTMARFERTIKRLIFVIVIAVIALFASNMAWLYAWNQYDYSDVVVDSEDGGNANYIGASGIINNNVKGNSEESNKEK
jgi:membrane associated rhomboid family serine protease